MYSRKESPSTEKGAKPKHSAGSPRKKQQPQTSKGKNKASHDVARAKASKDRKVGKSFGKIVSGLKLAD